MKPDDYLIKISRVSIELQNALASLRADWKPEDPPVTLSWAVIGRTFAESFDLIEDEKRVEFFRLIEGGMESGNRSLMDAVATGLIEAMIAVSDRNPGLWARMAPYFKGRSLEYAHAWFEFTSGKIID